MKKPPTLGDIYGQMLKGVQVVQENAQENINKSKKVPKQSKNAFSEINPLQKGGPSEKGGYHKALNDDYDDCREDEERRYDNLDKLKEKLKNPNLSDKQRQTIEKAIKDIESGIQSEEAEERIHKESKKIARDRLNTFMTKKSTFDKLFESVMGGAFDNQEDAQEVDALGLGDAPMDDEFGDDEMEMGGDEDQVTFTLDRATAQKLHDVLMGVLDGGMEDEGDDLDFDTEDDFGGDDEVDEDAEDAEEEDDFSYDEDEESGTFPTDKVGNDGTVGAKDGKGGGQQHKFQGRSNKVNGRPQPKGQKTKVVGTTDKVGNDGDHGHALHGAKQPDMGKQNKVSDIRQAEDFFR
jgi:hypothetical protein